MGFLNRGYKAARGLVLLLRHARTFDSTLLRGKRVAVVGPASSAYNTNLGSYIDAFDYVVRINKAPLVLKSGKDRADIGSRTDILFHSFFENLESGGGPLDFYMYDELGIKYVVNPIPGFFGYRGIFNFYKKYLSNRRVFILPAVTYAGIKEAFGRFRPTTGFCALKAMLESEFSELYITGFTFFKTAYADGYRDSRKEIEQTKKYLLTENIHNPDIEYAQFKALLQKNSHKNVKLDGVLANIIKTN